MLQGTYNFSFVAASLVVAFFASYATLHLVQRISTLKSGAFRNWWLIGGAGAMGVGIWSMHFVGMLAFSLPVPLGYDAPITLLSLVIAILVAHFALRQVTRDTLSTSHLVKSGVLMGFGITMMHYVGMHAMRMHPSIEYDAGLVVLSFLVAVGASTAAMWIAFTLRTRSGKFGWLLHLAAALVMGLAITGMHYIGMAAANFPLGSICGAASGIDAKWLSVTVVLATLGILTIALMLSVLDARLELRTNLFNRSLEDANEKQQYQAMHDALTDLPNRHALTRYIQHAIESSTQNGRGFAVYFVDVDGFKVINDTLGHGIGDQILQELAIRLKDVVGSSGVVARFGGDEFVVVVDDIADANMAAANAERLTRCFMDEFHLPGARMNISASVGISLFPEHGTTMSELLSHSDVAMYAAKAFGGSNYRFFEASMDVDATRKMEIRLDLQVAPECGQMFVVFQPKFDCKTGQVVGAEALLRWRHPRFGMVSPAEFIPIAEQSGQIGRIGKWVMTQVCENIAGWIAAGTPMVPIAVNLSLVQLHSATLVDDILNLTNKHGVSSGMVMFEITESVAIRNAQETMRSLDRLRQAGFELAIDDFGTGYSSLSHLQQFSVSQIKVDRMFVKDLSETNIKGRSMVAAIIGLAHSMGMVVVAEGVETLSQAAILGEMSCDQFQGFLYAKPLLLEDFVALLTNDKALAA